MSTRSSASGASSSAKAADMVIPTCSSSSWALMELAIWRVPPVVKTKRSGKRCQEAGLLGCQRVGLRHGETPSIFGCLTCLFHGLGNAGMPYECDRGDRLDPLAVWRARGTDMVRVARGKASSRDPLTAKGASLLAQGGVAYRSRAANLLNAIDCLTILSQSGRP